MPERIRERLDDDDTIAAAQILSWIARPHIPAFGLSLLLPSEKRPNRVESQRPAFQKDFIRGLQAGGWFDAKVTAADPDWESKTLFPRENWTDWKMAGRYLGSREGRKDNAIRAIRNKRGAVAHLASAVRTALLNKCLYEGRPVPRSTIYAHLRPVTSTTLPNPILPDLNPLLFVQDPDWVQDAIELAEERLQLALEVGAFDSADFRKFYRDTF